MPCSAQLLHRSRGSCLGDGEYLRYRKDSRRSICNTGKESVPTLAGGNDRPSETQNADLCKDCSLWAFGQTGAYLGAGRCNRRAVGENEECLTCVNAVDRAVTGW